MVITAVVFGIATAPIRGFSSYFFHSTFVAVRNGNLLWVSNLVTSLSHESIGQFLLYFINLEHAVSDIDQDQFPMKIAMTMLLSSQIVAEVL